MSVSVEGSGTPLLGEEEGEREKHFSGGDGMEHAARSSPQSGWR